MGAITESLRILLDCGYGAHVASLERTRRMRDSVANRSAFFQIRLHFSGHNHPYGGK